MVFSKTKEMKLEGYCDADWGGDYLTRRSTTGYIFLFGNSPISWLSKLQKTVALSSCEAEYMALKEAIKEQIWLLNLFEQLGLTYTKTPIRTDSQSAIALAHNPEHHARTKHIDIQYHFIREALEKHLADISYIPTSAQIADGLTKALDPTKFKKFIHRMGLISITFS